MSCHALALSVYAPASTLSQAASRQHPRTFVPSAGKHDALGQYPPPKGGARYDEPATFSADEWYNELKGVVQWAQGLGAKVLPA